MFDIGFSEIVLIGVVALVVIGPERLPKVARTVGLLVGRVQRYVATVKADISQEIQLDELKKSGEAFKQSLEQGQQQFTQEIGQIEQTIHHEISEISLTDTVTTPEQTALATSSSEHTQGELVLEPPAVPHHQNTV
ncbi:MAG: twin-arginine translocase subunit TatB [Sulfuriferula sp.]|nr:twin-arginine translocase subunit TatB [Sulfuriferula sp.]